MRVKLYSGQEFMCSALQAEVGSSYLPYATLFTYIHAGKSMSSTCPSSRLIAREGGVNIN